MITEYSHIQRAQNLPRLPLEGNIDLTYRCNNNCRHCWLRIPPESADKKEELSFGEIRKLVDDARKMGCRRWSVSGGEPMLRPDFHEIFDYITANSGSYSINTNGTLITPKIAKLLKRKGVKMVVLYGATADIHDHITRSPGSFEAAMRGFSYLKEAGTAFTVQLIPMKDNYHQFKEMISLAESLSKYYRVGAGWLFLSACGDKERNAEIIRQRLSPKDAVELDKPDLSYEESIKGLVSPCAKRSNDKYLFRFCIKTRRDFHIDPYGKMTFCCFIKDPLLRYDLRKGNFQECWDKFIPSLATKVKVNEEYKSNCGSCELREDCRFCPVYAYLEHRDYNKKVEYLCAAAGENRKFKENWLKEHRRYFRIAGITIQVDADLPINNETFHSKFKYFIAAGPGEDNVTIRHHFSLPDLNLHDLGREVYRKLPWAIYKKGDSWIYLGISSRKKNNNLHQVAVFNSDHTKARIYNRREEDFLKGNLHSLTMLPTDQLLLARILADRGGLYLHSCGAIFEGKGLLFTGHSEAGKSTMARLLKGKAEILCDDRMIVRRQRKGFRIYGTWSHGEVPEISANSAPLRAILFLEKSPENKLILLEDKKEISRRILSCLIRPFISVDWWEKTLFLVDKIVKEVPCYILHFDKSGEVVDLLKQL